ncbi:hypothetical protein OF83DRAFT_1174502 [Amylostereum chailletii]|nr:hypothetical protein OF83DRAFT_1174502 [Amylostereum chailletii]
MPSSDSASSKGSFVHIYISSSTSANHLYIAIPTFPQDTPASRVVPPVSTPSAVGNPPPYSGSVADDALLTKSLGRGTRPPAYRAPTLEDRLIAQDRMLAEIVRSLHGVSDTLNSLSNTVDRVVGHFEEIRMTCFKFMDTVTARLDTMISLMENSRGTKDVTAEADADKTEETQLENEEEAAVLDSQNASEPPAKSRMSVVLSVVEFVYDTARCAGLNLIF